jgi:hypothetical protein
MTRATMKRDGETVVKTAGKDTANTDANLAANAGGWPVDDITGLARRLPEVDPANYFDGQAKESFQQSLLRWPVLARLMKLVPADERGAPIDARSAAGHNPAHTLEVE